jgi:CelD/BcsL family acetyltransferase involved in cellulose biosynthesis
MKLYTLDPLLDSRWDKLVLSHPDASVFHQRGWLEALSETYGYRPIVVTSAPPGQPLTDGIVFCEVQSWITGRRLVSLPFADHCEPLQNEARDAVDFLAWILTQQRSQGWKYVELRPCSSRMNCVGPLSTGQSFWHHTLDLSRTKEQIFLSLHKNSMQRRIQRAERGQLSCHRGCSDDLLDEFYRLLMITRRRHQLLPQPRAWFRNLAACMNPHVEILVARQGTVPIAAMLILRHCRTVVYKYGCSDERFHHLAGMPFLFWNLIQEAKASGAELIDLGRTDLDNPGLIRFKDHLGTSRRKFTYLRYEEGGDQKASVAYNRSALRHLFSVLPDAISSAAGRLLYRHIG